MCIVQKRKTQTKCFICNMFVFYDRQKSYHGGLKSWSHIQLLIGISLDGQMRGRRKSMCKSPIGVCLIGECLGTTILHPCRNENRSCLNKRYFAASYINQASILLWPSVLKCNFYAGYSLLFSFTKWHENRMYSHFPNRSFKPPTQLIQIYLLNFFSFCA